MSSKTITRFFIKFEELDINDQELEWLKIQVFNNLLKIDTWYDPKPKTYDEAEQIASEVFIPLEYYVSSEGLFRSIGKDLNIDDIEKIAKLLQTFLIEFNRNDIIKSLGFSISYGEFDDIEDFDYSEQHLFALKISKEKYEILNLNDWLNQES